MEKNRKYKLTICIPTFERANILSDALFSLVNVTHGLDVAILVIDNNSQDNTDEIIESYKDRIIYQKNEKNIGGDLNILKCFIEASKFSKYVCVLGDSYRITRTYVEYLLELISYDKYNLIVNARGQLPENMCFSNPDDLLKYVGGGMDLTGTIIIRSEGVNKTFYNKYLDSNFIHFGMAFEYIASREKPLVFCVSNHNIRCIKIKRHNTWHKNAFTIFVNNWANTIQMLPPMYSYESKITCMKSHDKLTGIFSLYRLLSMRAARNLFSKDIKNHENNVKKTINLPFHYVLAVSYLPPLLCIVIIFFYKCLRKIKNFFIRNVNSGTKACFPII